MIILKNQLALQFNLGTESDFIDIQHLDFLRIVENAGGLRPILEMHFEITKPEIIPLLNQGNIISMMYGIKEPTSDILQFEIQGDSKNKEYHVGSKVAILGAMYNRGFTSQIKSCTFPKKKSFEVLRNIAVRDGMNFITNVNSTNDSQTWYQTGLKDWTMLGVIASRAYKDSETFFTYAFDNNNIYFYDVREQLKKGPKWLLSVTSTGEDENSPIVNIGTYYCDDSQLGVNAELAGKNVTTIGYNLDTGEFSNPKYNLKTFTTMDTTKLNINENGCKNYNYMITTNEEHNNSIEAQNQNRRNNILFSSYTCYVPIVGQYRDFKLLDCVRLLPAERDEEASGIYFITGIAKEYKNNIYTTVLTLNRESANGIDGDNLVQGG